MDSSDTPRTRGSLIAGTILLVVGALFLLNNFDFIYLGPAIEFWPLIIVAIGVSRFLTAEHPYQRRKAGWWILIGLWLLISTAHLFGFSFHNSWPLLLIVLGINSILKALDPRSSSGNSKGYYYAN
jgi:hypothetical protein